MKKALTLLMVVLLWNILLTMNDLVNNPIRTLITFGMIGLFSLLLWACYQIVSIWRHEDEA